MEQMAELTLYRPKPNDLIAFLPFACRQLEAPFQLRILVETIEEYVSKSTVDDKSKKSKRDKTPQAQTSVGQYSAERVASVADQDFGDENDVVLRARCDPQGRPVELLFHRCVQVPRMLLKIIGLCIPYHEQLARIGVRWGTLDGSALYEIAKLLPLSQVTEVYLDDSPVPHRNYHLLLERRSRLRSLSLARCGLTDVDCAALAARLAHPLPASLHLVCLSLESNRIGDEGARALGEVLRTNRSLRHLNLAGNAITSLGAAHLLASLVQFPVSSDDMLLKRRRIFERLKLKKDTYARCYRELTRWSEQSPDGGRGRTRTTSARSRRGSTATLGSMKGTWVEALESRAEAMAAELIGTQVEPFDPTGLVRLGGVTYCAGNFSLTYLNLAYNDLDCTSARRLASVLAYQAEAAPRAEPGLLRVVLEGNALPEQCEGARVAEELLERSLAVAGATPVLQVKPGRKSERPKLK